MNELSKEQLLTRHCEACEGGVPPLSDERIRALLSVLHDDWRLSDDGLRIFRNFEFPAYSRTLGFANAAAWVAIKEGHHPVLSVSYGSCEVSYTTHAVNALTENDFICAAKIDALLG